MPSQTEILNSTTDAFFYCKKKKTHKKKTTQQYIIILRLRVKVTLMLSEKRFALTDGTDKLGWKLNLTLSSKHCIK